MIFRSIVLLLSFLWSHVLYSQNDKQYYVKAVNQIKNFHSKLNLILDPENPDENRKITKNNILNEMIQSRTETKLYDNISHSDIKANYLEAQNYLDKVFILVKSQTSDKNIDQNYFSFEYDEIKNESILKNENKEDKEAKTNFKIKLISISPTYGKQTVIRTDTITFVVIFESGDLDSPKIRSSFKYQQKNILEEISDNDKDGIEDIEDLCPKESGTKYCNGCPDSDGDGICNKYDKCPDLKGKLNNFGCPDEEKKTTTIKEIGKKEIPTQSYPIIIIPVSISVKELTNKRKHKFSIVYAASFTTNFKSNVIGDFIGEEKLILKITILPDREKNTKNAKFDLLEILMNETNTTYINNISIVKSLDVENEFIKFEYKIDLNKEKYLLEYLKSLKK